MGQDPREIQQQIEQTREHMGDTVEALAYKADVPARMRDSVNDKKEAVVSKVTGVKDRVVGSVGGAASQTGDVVSGAAASAGDAAGSVGHKARQGVGVAQENPLGLAVAGAAAGFLIGMLLPATRIEDERIGGVADQVKQQAMDVGQEALERGREVAQEAASAAAETVKESGAEHGRELAESARDGAADVQSSTTST
jgi:hypothetical protein